MAVDAYVTINGVRQPIGKVVSIATLKQYGLQGGGTPGFYPGHGDGGRDWEHVQIPNSGVNKNMISPTLTGA
jgi:hypothetical protein